MKAREIAGAWSISLLLHVQFFTAKSCSMSGPIYFLDENGMELFRGNIKNISGRTVAVDGDVIIGTIKCSLNMDKRLRKEILSFKTEFDRIESRWYEINRKYEGRQLDIITQPTSTRWANSVVPFDIDPSFSLPMHSTIVNAAWTWTHNSPARFQQSPNATDLVMFSPVHDIECVSLLGHAGGLQDLYVNDGGCTAGQVLHEVGHALGFSHENMRPDSSNYIIIAWNLVISGYLLAYEDTDGTYLYGKENYDYGSIMHYNKIGFSKNGQPTIIVLEPQYQNFLNQYPNDLPRATLGQRSFLSTMDKKMSYLYLGKCYSDKSPDSAGSDKAGWVAAPFGGCAVLCDGNSFRQRLVTCREGGQHNGACVSEAECDPASKPSVYQSCELNKESLVVSFDETNLWEVGGVMDNVAFYDQFDWYLWSGYPPAITPTGNAFQGSIKLGPGKDTSMDGNGKYLLFSSSYPAQEGDQCWYESPVIETQQASPCGVSFSWFIAGGDALLTVELVFCSDCHKRTVLWTGTRNSQMWQSQTITLSPAQDKVRLRFVGQAGKDDTSFVGLDNIQFTENCIRHDMFEGVKNISTDGNMTYPYPEPILSCARRNFHNQGFKWTTLPIVLVSISGAVFCACFTCCCEYVHRRNQYKKVLKLEPASKKAQAAARNLTAMNFQTLGSVIRQTAVYRSQSVAHIGPSLVQQARASVQRMSILNISRQSSVRSSVGLENHPSFHRNKSVCSTSQQNDRRITRRNVTTRFSFIGVAQAADETGVIDRMLPFVNFFHLTKKDSAGIFVENNAGSAENDKPPSNEKYWKRNNRSPNFDIAQDEEIVTEGQNNHHYICELVKSGGGSEKAGSVLIANSVFEKEEQQPEGSSDRNPDTSHQNGVVLAIEVSQMPKFSSQKRASIAIRSIEGMKNWINRNSDV